MLNKTLARVHLHVAALLTKWLISTQHTRCMLLFLVLIVISTGFQILRSYIALIQVACSYALLVRIKPRLPQPVL